MSAEQPPRKKTLWAVVGLAGACAVCCAIPIAALVAGGATMAGLAGALSQRWDVIACGVLMLIVVGAGLLAMRPRRPAPSCSADGACDCKEKA